MNKYQEALDWLVDNSKLDQFNIGNSQSANEIIQELVDKETPTKLNVNVDKEYCRCKCNLDFWEIDLDYFKRKGLSYCPNCGQKIDWSDEDE